jgi:YihY family inner membrane protein
VTSSRVAQLRARSPFVDVVMETMAKRKLDNERRMSAEITYYAFFAIFPLLMVFVTVVDIIFSSKASEKIVNSAVSQFPVIGSDIINQVNTPEGRSVATAIALITALWAGSHAFESFEHAIDVVWRGPAAPPTSVVKSRLRAFFMMGIVGVAILVVTIVGALLSRLHFVPGVDRVVTTLVTLALNTAVILVAFAAVTPGGPRWKAQLPGAVLGGVGWTILQTVGALFVQHVVRGASDIYGVFAVVIGMLVWINIQIRMFLIAAEVNSVLAARGGDTAVPVEAVAAPH